MVSNTLTASDLQASSSVVSDSEVDDDLTISGGTIDDTVIGSTTAVAGTFSTLTANTSVSFPNDSIGDDEIDNVTPADVMKSGAVVVIDGAGSAISTGEKKYYVQWPFNCTLTKITLLADQDTSTTVDVWKDSLANFPPTDADSLFVSASEPALSSATSSETTSFDSTTINAGDIMCFNVDANDSAQNLSIVFQVTKN